MAKQKKDDTGKGFEIGPSAEKKAPSEVIYTRILEQTAYRTRQDIDSWRSALMTAENIEWPNRDALLRLYSEVEIDAHLHAIISQRVLKILGRNFELVSSTDVPDKEATALLRSDWFYTVLKLAMESEWYGHSLIQLWQPLPNGFGQVVLVPRRHVYPERGTYSIMQNDISSGIPYRGTPLMDWLIEVGSNRGLGLYKLAAPAFILKKNALLQWSQYTEIFGMPMRYGTTASRTQTDMQRMADNLKKMGSAAYAVLQQGEEIKFIESTKGDAYQVYDKLIERCNSELSKLILGQTMTTDNGSSRSQAQVHERVADIVHYADAITIENMVNTQLLPIMAKHGYKVKGLRFKWIIDIDKDALWLKTKDIINSTEFTVEENWIKETFGIPVLRKEKQPEEGSSPQNEPSVDSSAPKNGGGLKKKTLKLLSELNNLYTCSCAKCGGTVQLTADDMTPFVFDEEAFLNWVYDNRDKALLNSSYHRSTFNDLWRSYSDSQGGNFDNVDLASQIQRNLYRFSAAKAYTLQNALRDELTADMSREDFKTAATQLLAKFNGQYRAVEKEYVFASGQGVKTWDSFKANAEAYPHTTLRTVGDAHVRPEHAILDGLTMALTDSQLKRIWAPLGPGCRCINEQSDGEITPKEVRSSLLEQAKLNPKWLNNTALTGVVFKEEHNYYKGGVKALVNTLTP